MKTAFPVHRGAEESSGDSRTLKRLEAVPELMRRIRAYNELARLGPQALQRIGDDPEELDRVLRGLPPRTGQSR